MSLAGGRFLTWSEWTAVLGEAVGREIPMQRMAPAELIEMGRDLDRLRATKQVDLALSEEAAILMTSGAPTDDSATLASLGGSWRPTLETFRDTVAWLAAEGHVAPEDGLDMREVRSVT
jgi:hypothetical protein